MKDDETVCARCARDVKPDDAEECCGMTLCGPCLDQHSMEGHEDE